MQTYNVSFEGIYESLMPKSGGEFEGIVKAAPAGNLTFTEPQIVNAVILAANQGPLTGLPTGTIQFVLK